MRRIACTGGRAGVLASTFLLDPESDEPHGLASLCRRATLSLHFIFGPPLLGQGTGLRRPGRGLGWYRQGDSAAQKVWCLGISLLGQPRAVGHWGGEAPLM